MAIRIPRVNKAPTLAARDPNAVNARRDARNKYLERHGRPGAKPKPLKPVAAPPAVVPPPVAAAPEPAPVAAPVQPAVESNTLFPNARMFEPQNYAGSPMYQFQVQEGQKQLAKSLASRGLSGSGHAIEEELNIPLRVAAQDTDRMTNVAMQNADRLATMQNNEALRLERSGNEQWNRAYSLADLMASQNPMQYAAAGLNNVGDIMRDAGQAQANFLKDYYDRVMPAGGGGGGRGGGGAPGMPATVPTGPDYRNIRPTEITGNYESNNGWLGILTNALGGFLK